jgi:hypothetical protein
VQPCESLTDFPARGRTTRLAQCTTRSEFGYFTCLPNNLSDTQFGPYILVFGIVDESEKKPRISPVSVMEGLRRMPRLRHLMLYINRPSRWPPLSHDFPFKLLSFMSTFPMDGATISFFNTQPEIHALRFYTNISPNTPLPGDTLPSLSFLSAPRISFSPQFPSSIMSHRPVEYVCMDNLDPIALQDLLLSTVPIRGIRVRPLRVSSIPLSFSLYAPNLEILSSVNIMRDNVRIIIVLCINSMLTLPKSGRRQLRYSCSRNDRRFRILIV